jgi:hypothetical protein
MRTETMMSANGGQPAEQPASAWPDAYRMADANINPLTGLSTDYLNHFNEAIMLLEMVPQVPDCALDLFAWQPMSYREHFAASRLKERDAAISCYEKADPKLRQGLDALANTMTAILTATRDAMQSGLPAADTHRVSRRAVEWLKPLVARAGAVINGADGALNAQDMAPPQDMVDALMRR